MSRSEISLASWHQRHWVALLALILLSVFGAVVVGAQSVEEDASAPAAEDEDFGAGDFSAPSATEEEAPQRIDLGNSGGGAITPEQAAQGASQGAPSKSDGEAGAEAGVDDSVFVPTEEIRVDTAIAFPVDI